jgi:sugar phosphate isomerase/epimerase
MRQETPKKPELALSSWSVHRALGGTYPNSPARNGPPMRADTYGAGTLDLLDFPAAAARLGVERIEICHFHFPSRETAYLDDLKAAIGEAGVVFQTMLIDDGDISDPENGARDREWVAGWLETAAALGAEAARVIAGKRKATPDLAARSAANLKALGRQGRAAGVRVITENWHDLMSEPETVHRVLDGAGDDVGFLADTGNWKPPAKYDDLAAIFPRADYCHAHGPFDAALTIDAEEFGRCLDIAVNKGFRGPYTLIYGGPNDDEWSALARQRDFVRERVGGGGIRAAGG